jgi:tetratricopeptide (TPR) repeat protein
MERFFHFVTAHAPFLFIFFCVAAYGFHLQNGFVSLDDNYLIYENPAVKQLTPQTLAHVFTTYDPQLYIPLTFVSYQLTAAVVGMNPFFFHLGNMLLHIGSTILLWKIFRKLGASEAVALGASLLWAIHPLQTEAVLWAAARKDTLATFFLCLSVWLYLRHCDTRRGLYFWLSVGMFALALLSKVSVIVLPLALLLLDWYEQRKLDWQAWIEKIPYFVLSIIFGLIAVLGKTRVLGATDPWQNALIACKSTFFYLYKIIAPFGFTVIYPQVDPVSLTQPMFLLTSVGLILLIVFLGFLLITRRIPVLGFGLGWYLLFLLPNLPNFSKNGFLFFASDRYAYLASIGVFFFIATLLSSLARKHTSFVIGVFALPLIILTFLQGFVWHDSEALYRNAIVLYPRSPMAHNNLGMELEPQGKKEEAKAEFLTAIEQSPTQSIPYFNLAALAGKEGDIAGAVNWYKKIAPNLSVHELTSPNEFKRFFWLSDRLTELGESGEAVVLLKRLIELAPNNADAHLQLATLHHQMGYEKEAMEELEKARELGAVVEVQK